jgi:hypothetical protein
MFKLTSLLLAFLLPISAFIAPLGEDPLFDEGRSLISQGKLGEAKVSVTNSLSSSPYSTEGYQLMYTIAKREASTEEQLRWGKWLVWSYTASGKKDESAVIEEELSVIYTAWNVDHLIIDEWQENVAKAAKKAGSSKQYRLAGHLLSKLLAIDPKNKKLNKSWESLADAAGNEVSGGAFVSDKVRRKSASWLEKNNARHSDWDTRWQRKTKYYDVNTNLDYEFFETVCAAMTQMNEFYRSVYEFGKKKTKHVKLLIGAKRTDFDRFSMELLGRAMQSDSIGGYWVRGLSTVASFDRSLGDPNLTKDDLWTTLFHEASHQFMAIKMDKNEGRGIFTPVWLNEGTASYFEGSVIKADGTILKNNVAEHRLREWWALENSDMKHSLKDLIAHERNTSALNGSKSYEGDYYSYGWALVYFLLNYEENDRRVYGAVVTPGEDEDPDFKAVTKAGKLIYRQPYLNYLEYFSKKGNVDNDQFMPLDMAKKFFVDDVKDPDVPDWEAFEERWRKFTVSLHREMMKGSDFADTLQARSRGYIEAKDFERARATAELADNKRPFDAETYRLLAQANLGEGLDGDALFWMFRHWETMWEAGDSEAVKVAEEWLEDNGAKSILKYYIEPTKIAVAATEDAMESSLEDGHPICGPLFASYTMQALQLNFTGMKEKSVELSEMAGQDLRAWQAAFTKSKDANRKVTLNNGDLVDAVKYEPDGVLIYDPEGRPYTGAERTNISNLTHLSPPFSMRGELIIDGKVAVFAFGIGRTGTEKSLILFINNDAETQIIEFQTYKTTFKPRGGGSMRSPVTIGGEKFTKEEKISFQLDIDSEGGGTYSINSKQSALPEDFDLTHFTGGFAIEASDDTAVLFKNIVVRPSAAFWPVSPAVDDD